MKPSLVLRFLAVVVVLLIAAYVMRPSPRAPVRPEPDLPKPSPLDLPAEPETALPPAPTRPRDRRELLQFLDRLGRALVTGDERTVVSLRSRPPVLYRDDVPWLLERTGDPLFPACGATEICLWYRLREAVPVLDVRLKSATSVFLKDQIVRVLGGFDGEAEAVLIAALASEPEGSVRVRIVSALSRFHGSGTDEALLQSLRHDPDPRVRRSAMRSLATRPGLETFLDLLRTVRQVQDDRIRADLFRDLFETSEESVRPVLENAIRDDSRVVEVIRERVRLHDGSRYAAGYPDGFFDSPLPPVPWDASRMKRIGITVNLTASGGMTLPQAAAHLFRGPPLDRYRHFFYLRNSAEFEEDLASGTDSPRAWDASGTPVPGGLPAGELESTVYLHFQPAESFGPGILGYTEGSEAHVTNVSLLHEFGHAFARLGDEYDSPAASDGDGTNLDASDSPRPRWQPLIDQGHLDGVRRLRGDRLIPAGDCHMNSHPGDSRWCPVCQLEIISRICERTEAVPPW